MRIKRGNEPNPSITLSSEKRLRDMSEQEFRDALGANKVLRGLFGDDEIIQMLHNETFLSWSSDLKEICWQCICEIGGEVLQGMSLQRNGETYYINRDPKTMSLAIVNATTNQVTFPERFETEAEAKDFFYNHEAKLKKDR